MSQYDEIHCKMKLPEDSPEYFKENPFFQTHDLEGIMAEYTITEEGEITLDNWFMKSILVDVLQIPKENIKPEKLYWKRKKIQMYSSNCCGGGNINGKYVMFTKDGSDCIEISYVVQIRNGKVSSIKESSRSVRPAIKVPER
jgi:hypothetical protein